MSINRMQGCWGPQAEESDWLEIAQHHDYVIIGGKQPKRKPEKTSPNWQSQLAAAWEEIAELSGGANKQAARLAQLESDVRSIRILCETVLANQSIIVPITSFTPEPFELIKDIQAVVQPDEDSFVATFFDANVNASGDTQQDAIANLKSLILELFETLSKEKYLGKGLARKFETLKSFIRKRE